METLPTMTIDNLINHLRTECLNGDIEFVAACSTPWHSLGIATAIEVLNSCDPGLIAIDPHPSSGYLLESDDFNEVQTKNRTFVKISDQRDGSVATKIRGGIETVAGFGRAVASHSVGNMFNIIVPGHRYNPYARLFADSALAAELQPQFVSVDIGAGMYFDTDEKPLRTGTNNLKLPYNWAIEKLKHQYFRRVPRIDRSCFDIVDGRLVVKSKIIEQYKSLLPKLNSNKSGSLLFITQPFSQIGVVDPEEEHSIINDFIEEVDQKILLRPHPREEEQRYRQYAEHDHIEIAVSSEPLERDLPDLRPNAVVGFTSTALLTTSVLYDLPSYTIAPRLFGSITDESFRKEVEQFLQLAANYVSLYDSEY